MPSALEVFNRTNSEAVKGDRAASMSFKNPSRHFSAHNCRQGAHVDSFRHVLFFRPKLRLRASAFPQAFMLISDQRGEQITDNPACTGSDLDGDGHARRKID